LEVSLTAAVATAVGKYCQLKLQEITSVSEAAYGSIRKILKLIPGMAGLHSEVDTKPHTQQSSFLGLSGGENYQDHLPPA
jgi:hypothetical protein